MDGGNGWFSWLKKVFISYSQCCATIVALRKHWHLSSCRLAILCTCLLLILEAGDLNSHENHPLPPALSDDWKHRFGNKSNLMTFILIIYLAPLQGAYSEAPSPATTKQRLLKQLEESSHIITGHQAQLQWEPIPGEGLQNWEGSVLPEGWAGPRNKKLTLGRRAQSPTGGYIRDRTA